MADIEEGRLCIRCGFMAGKKDSYCQRCGAPVINRCMSPGPILGEPCGHVNDNDGAFCAKCGSYTAYYKAGLLNSAYTENQVLSRDELDEMNWFQHRFFAD